MQRGIYDPPSEAFRQMGELERNIEREKRTFSELRSEYSIESDLLSEAGRKRFL